MKEYWFSDMLLNLSVILTLLLPVIVIITVVMAIRKKNWKRWLKITALDFVLLCVFGIGSAVFGCQHEYNEVITKEATCTSDGIITRTCTLCGFETEKEITL